MAGPPPSCSFGITRLTHNGKLQTVRVPVPGGYTCSSDTDFSQCWVRLRYDYGSSLAPTDVTTWRVSLIGDPVGLVE